MQDGFLSKKGIEMILSYITYSINKFKYYYIFTILIILCSFLGIFPRGINEYFVQITAMITFVLGLPLSSGLRIDQLSQNYPLFSRELLLLCSFLVSFLNITFISVVKYFFFGIKKNNSNSDENLNKKKKI